MITKPRWNRTSVLIICFVVIYVATVVPVGMFLYTLKSNLGWNAFKHGGYHTYLKCLAVSVELADMPRRTVVPVGIPAGVPVK